MKIVVPCVSPLPSVSCGETGDLYSSARFMNEDPDS